MHHFSWNLDKRAVSFFPCVLAVGGACGASFDGRPGRGGGGLSALGWSLVIDGCLPGFCGNGGGVWTGSGDFLSRGD